MYMHVRVGMHMCVCMCERAVGWGGRDMFQMVLRRMVVVGGFGRCSVGRTPGRFDDGLGRRESKESLGWNPTMGLNPDFVQFINKACLPQDTSACWTIYLV